MNDAYQLKVLRAAAKTVVKRWNEMTSILEDDPNAPVMKRRLDAALEILAMVLDEEV